MGWRPDEGWISGQDIHFEPNVDKGFVYEAGANAYGEALKKQGTSVVLGSNCDDPTLSFVENVLVKLPSTNKVFQKGKLVFIPDDKALVADGQKE